MGLGLEPKWAQDSNTDGPRIANQVGLGLQPQVLQPSWAWICNPGGCGIANQVGLGLQLKSTQDCKQKGLELECRWN